MRSLILALLIIALICGCVHEEGKTGSTTTTTSTSLVKTATTTTTTTTTIQTKVSGPEKLGSSRIRIPAINEKGEGVIIELTVDAIPGQGRILTDIDNLLFWVDTQYSIRTARGIASNVTDLDLSKIDLIYTIYANASVVGGESAGTAITIATIAAIQNRSLNNSVIATGRINHDGSIGPVSAIIEKARAAKEENATLFLVPLLQSREVIYETKKHCEEIGWTEFCTVEQIPRKIDVEDETGIRVREVGDIREAMRYFFG
ncbi:MAG: hypothetical protein DRO62_01410 [Candidatus Altiarchaeales archaeon]|nr:MAG: hypothetical protein DRO62_01410 [Candidatus Altiarchaeales archaeon]